LLVEQEINGVMKLIIFSVTGMVGKPCCGCLRDEAVESCRVKATFNPWANGLFEFCRAAEVYVVSITCSIDTKRHVLAELFLGQLDEAKASAARDVNA